MKGMFKRIKDKLKTFKPSYCCGADRKTFCIIDEWVFVKCIGCGNESFPWLVSKEKADAFKRSNPNQIQQIVNIENKIKLINGENSETI